MARLPPLGYSSFFLQPHGDGSGCRAGAALAGAAPAARPPRSSNSVAVRKGEQYIELDNGLVSLRFDRETGGLGAACAASGCTHSSSPHSVPCTLRPAAAAGLLADMKAGDVSARLSASFGWYNASDGLEAPPEENRGQASGAYIFRWGAEPGAETTSCIHACPACCASLIVHGGALAPAGCRRPNGFFELPEEGASSWWVKPWQCLWRGGGSGGAAACGKGRPKVQLEVVEGETVSEVRQVFADWAMLVTR